MEPALSHCSEGGCFETLSSLQAAGTARVRQDCCRITLGEVVALMFTSDRRSWVSVVPLLS